MGCTESKKDDIIHAVPVPTNAVKPMNSVETTPKKDVDNTKQDAEKTIVDAEQAMVDPDHPTRFQQQPMHQIMDEPSGRDPVVIFKEKLRQKFEVEDLIDVGIAMWEEDCLKNLQKLCDAQLEMTEEVVKQNFFDIKFQASKVAMDKAKQAAESKIEESEKQKEVIQKMKEINNLNWQYQILQNNKGKYIPINDYESMIIGAAMKKIINDPMADKSLELISIGMKVNMYSSVCLNKQGKLKVMQKAISNERFNRQRPEQNESAVEHSVCLQQNSFCADIGAYGQEWGRQVHNDNNAQPSFNEMMDGIFQWYHGQVEEEMKGKTKQEQIPILNASKKMFNEIIKSAAITNPDKKFTIRDPELGVKNPYSNITCFILMLYSMEFGNPPLYVEVNRIMREWDLRYLRTLGPIASVIGFIAGSGEKWREENDQIPMGETLKKNKGTGVNQNLAGCFLLFRGAQMKQEWLAPYEDNFVFDGKVIPEGNWKGHKWFVRLPGNTSCTEDLSVAFEFAFQNFSEEKTPTIFVFSCKNYSMPPGIRLNSEAYTAYPCEGETLLTEGTRIYVMLIQKGVMIDNPNSRFKPYNGKAITFVHSFIG